MFNYIVMDEDGREIGQISSLGVDWNPLNIRPAFTIGNIITLGELNRISQDVYEKLNKMFEPLRQIIQKIVEAMVEALRPVFEWLNESGILDALKAAPAPDRRWLRFKNRFQFIRESQAAARPPLATRLKDGHLYWLNL